WIFCFAQHAAELPCRADGKAAVAEFAGVPRNGKRCSCQNRETAQRRRHSFGRFVPSGAWLASLGQMRNVASRKRIARGAQKDPRTSRTILARGTGAGRRR